MAEGIGTARARDFVMEHGTPWARARLGALLGEDSAAVSVLLGQRADPSGALGRPDRPDEVPGPGSTAEALEALEAYGLLAGPLVEGAARFLTGTQCDDGSWADAGPDVPDARLVLTGALCGLLARTTCTRHSVLARAEAWLTGHWSEERVRAGDYAAIAAFAHAFANLPSELSDEALQWCGRELERGFRIGRFDALATARVLVQAGAHALPGARLQPGELCAAILAAQAPDAGWPGATLEDRVEASLEALRALRHLAPEAFPC